jgi:hypothetical protein
MRANISAAFSLVKSLLTALAGERDTHRHREFDGLAVQIIPAEKALALELPWTGSLTLRKAQR